MRDNEIPMDLLEPVFLSIIVHAVDHVHGHRVLWGLNFKFGFDWEQPSTMWEFGGYGYHFMVRGLWGLFVWPRGLKYTRLECLLTT